MADKIRNNTFLIKRSNVPGKVPTAGSLLLGELALNTSDVILYASGTTANSILPIGWDRVSRTGDTMTGGLFTPFLSATTISATSINRVDYIVFNTGTTSATTVPGTIYFDNTEKALSYNTSINQGVTVNLGQQNYIRVFNNSGADIPRGKALEILSAYSGLPAVTLAINIHEGFNIIGVSAEIIPNGKEGIAITNGVISNIELTGMTVGSLIYASDNVPGKLDDATTYLSFPLTARTNQIGFVVQTGVTTGKLFVNINNENSVLTLTDLERNVLEGNTLSTGAFEYTGMTTASTTTFNVAPLRGWIVKNTYDYALLPDVLGVYYTGGTNISVTNIATADSTYILINSGLTITQQTTFPTPQQRRENIFLGKVNHPNRTSILNINNTVDYDVSPMSSLRDLWSPIRLINDGIIPSPNGANLSFNTSAGSLWGNGINWHNNQLSPNNVNIAAKVPASFFYRTQTGGTTSSVTVINPRNYDVGGVITSIGNANLDSATNQRIYLYPTGVINVLYGQTVYTSLAAAVAAVQSEAFIPYPNAASTGILIGILSVRNDIGTDGQPLTNASYAKFTFVSKFGELLGGTGGISTTTLQQAYDNSATPEIVINAVLDGLSIKNGTGNADNVTTLLEGLNAAGAATSFIRADGDISGTTLQTNGFTGNSTGMSALTVNIRTIGSGTSITNLGIDSLGNVVSGTTGGNGSTFTGGTVSGATYFINGLTANTISATTYFNLPLDIRATGGTYNGGNIYITNNTGGTFTITGLTATGFSANYYGSFSDTTNQPVSGSSIATVWKYNTTELSNGISVVNNSQIKVANKGVYEIGYSAQLEKTLSTSADVTIWAAINGVPVTRSSSITSLVANSVVQLPFVSYIFELEANDYVEFYFSAPSQYVQLSTYSGLTSPTRPDAPSVIIVAKQVGLSVTDNLGGYYLALSGGTVSGATNFTGGLTANTISATTIQTSSFRANNGGITATTVSAATYYNLPLDIRVTGGTYSAGTVTMTNNTGGTFTVTGFSTSTATAFTGGTVTGATNFTGGLTANTISATTYFNLPLDIRVTGASYNNNTFTYTNNTGGTFNVLFNTLTGLTVNGNLTVTGNTSLQALTGTSAVFSGSGANILTVIGSGSTTSPIFSVQGSTGATIFSISDSTSGPLFWVDTASDVPVMELYDTSPNLIIYGGISASTLTASTVSATTYLNLPAEVFVTGSTYSNNTFTFRNNTGGTFNVLFNTVTGLTVNGNLTITGSTTSNSLSATTITGGTFYGNGSGLTGIPIAGVTNLQSSLDNKFDKSGGTVTGSVLITGDVTILGTATTINTQTLTIKDNIITINSNYTGNTVPYPGTSGIEVLRGSATTATLLWDETSQKWVAGITGNTKQILFSGDSLSLLSSGHTHPISEIINLQSSLDNKFDKSGGTISGNLTVTGNTISNSVSATTITGTTIYGNGSNLTGVVKGTGTNNYLAKWTGTTGISNSIIQDNGTNVGVGTSPASYTKLNVVTTAANSEAAISALNYNLGASGIKTLSIGGGGAGTMYGIFGEAYDAGTTNIGVYGYGHILDFSSTNAIGGKFEADGATNNYSVQLIDGTQGINKVLVSQTTDGKANWSDVLSGLTRVNATTISATTYQNLPLDIRVTGGTYAAGTATFTNNTGGTFNVTGFNTGSSTGLTASDYVVQGYLAASQTITSNLDTILQFSDDYDPQNWWNASSYRFTPTIAGYYQITLQVLIQAGTVTNNQYNTQIRKNGSNQEAIWQNQITTSTGVSQGNSKTIYMNGTTDYIDFTVYQGNPGSVDVFGSSQKSQTFFHAHLLSGLNSSSFTASNLGAGTGIFAQKSGVDLQFKSLTSTGGTVTITSGSTTVNLEVVAASNFTGGTVNGATNFTNGLTANTISATTYFNLPVTANTFTTGFTYSNNTFTISRNNGLSALTQTVNTMTGLTITGNLYVSGNTQSRFSGNSSSELVLITQTGTGDAFVVEDSANSDPSHFVINASGDTAIGLVQPLNGDKLTVSGNTSVYGILSATTVYSNSIGVKTNSPTFDLEVNGTFGATSKSFVIKHPTQEGKKLVYGAIEGPEFGVYVRGKVDGDIIELPEEWIGLVDENSITVQLTGDGMLKLLYVKKIKDNKVYISNMIPFIKSTGYYTVYGERKDIDKIKKVI